jgi:hypothetical protein
MGTLLPVCFFTANVTSLEAGSAAVAHGIEGGPKRRLSLREIDSSMIVEVQGVSGD